MSHSTNPAIRSPRLWPLAPILLVQLVALALSVTPQIDNLSRFLLMLAAPLLCSLAFLGWLFFASRLGWGERLAIAGGVAALGVGAVFCVHESVPTSLLVHGVPLTMFLIALGVAVGRSWTPAARTALVLAISAVGWAAFGLVRVAGFDGSYLPEVRWRWTPTPEELLVELEEARPVEGPTPAHAPVELSPLDWPGFRGSQRNSRAAGVRIRTDWESAPPRELWRIPVGPGWSSFAHVGGRLFTQEQRGDSEAVMCYDAETGAELWRHVYPSRFTEVVSGPGPRATPTFADGRLYALGAMAVLSCLDAATGELVWRRDLMAEIDAQLAIWGFSASPMVTHGLVIVYADGSEGRGLVAYDGATGEPAWHAAASGMNFASAQPATLAGVELVLFPDESGLVALDPATGELEWRFTPSGWKMAPMVQPQLVGERSIVVPLGDGVGVARMEVERNGEDWVVTERWSSPRLKPSFNDFVYFDGHLYGFDQSIFTCVDAETGARVWRRGRYGFGQVLLLEDSAALVVTAESGEAVLLAADPEEHRELGRIQALGGKTWNHPIAVGGRLFLRNGEEAACFELAAEGPR